MDELPMNLPTNFEICNYGKILLTKLSVSN